MGGCFEMGEGGVHTIYELSPIQEWTEILLGGKFFYLYAIFLLICVTQLAGGLLLEKLKYFKLC